MQGEKYLKLLSAQYPDAARTALEIIKLSSVLNLPKSTEHFVSDIHGEAASFLHVLKSGSGSIRKKIDDEFSEELTEPEKRELATLIYYPAEKLEIEENRLVFVDGSQVKLGEMRWYRTKGEQAWLCLKGHRFLWVDMAEWPEKKKGLFRMKLTQRGLLAGHFWKLPVAVCLAAVTLLGCAGVVWTATPYNGKLSWKIDEWRYPEKWQEPEKNKTEDIFL